MGGGIAGSPQNSLPGALTPRSWVSIALSSFSFQPKFPGKVAVGAGGSSHRSAFSGEGPQQTVLPAGTSKLNQQDRCVPFP